MSGGVWQSPVGGLQASLSSCKVRDTVGAQGAGVLRLGCPGLSLRLWQLRNLDGSLRKRRDLRASVCFTVKNKAHPPPHPRLWLETGEQVGEDPAWHATPLPCQWLLMGPTCIGGFWAGEGCKHGAQRLDSNPAPPASASLNPSREECSPISQGC